MAAPLGGEGGAGRQRNAAADDAIGAEIAVGGVEHVQRAAAAEAVAAAPSHHFRHQAVDSRALGQAVAVAAMIAGDDVGRPEVGANADRHRFLAGAKVGEAGDHAAEDETVHLLLESADQLHAPQQAERLLSRRQRRLRRLAGLPSGLHQFSHRCPTLPPPMPVNRRRRPGSPPRRRLRDDH